MKRKIIWVLLLSVLFCAICGAVSAEEGECGKQGDNVRWRLDEDVLTIFGSGAMTDFDSMSSVPWSNYGRKVREIVVEKGVTNIGDRSFSMCSDVTKVTLPGTVTRIGSFAFANCDDLTDIAIPGKVKTIDDMAFLRCYKLANVTLPDSLETIGSSAFANCTSLESINIPAAVKEIGGEAFDRCSKLKKFTADKQNQVFSANDGVLFKKDGILFLYPAGREGAYTIPAGTKTIGKDSFSHCEKLTAVTIPDSVTRIERNAFRECTGLTNLSIPGSVTEIVDFAFKGTDKVKKAVYYGTSEKALKELEAEYGERLNRPYLFAANVAPDQKYGSVSVSVKPAEYAIKKNNVIIAIIDGATVTVTATTSDADNYRFEAISTQPATKDTAQKAGTYQFTMPRSNTTATATFKAKDATAPTIQKQPESLTLDYNYPKSKNRKLQVTATAAQGHTLSYQWYYLDEQLNFEEIKGATSATYEVETGLNAGKRWYYCLITATLKNGNSAAALTNDTTVTVNPAKLTDVSVAQSGTLTYNGKEQQAKVTTAATAINKQPVTFTYSDKKDGTYKTTVPGLTNAGTYKIYYQASAPNHKTVSGNFTVTIGQAKVMYVVPKAISGLKYAEKAQDLVKAGSTSDGTMRYILGDNGKTAPKLDAAGTKEADRTWKTTVPMGTNTGTYYVWYLVNGDKNHKDTTPECIQVTIGKATPGYSVPTLKTLIYNGQVQSLVNAGKAKAGKMKYALGDNAKTAPDKGWSESVPTGTEPGTYHVWYKIEGNSNYTDVAPACLIATISKASLTAKVTLANWTYGHVANAPEVTGNTEGGTVTYAYKKQGAADSEYTPNAPKTAGAYTIQASIAETLHYKSARVTADFSVEKAPLTITADNKTITYGDAPANNGAVYAGFVNGENVSYLGGTLEFTYNYTQYGNAGTYTITPGGRTSDNYAITYTAGVLTVLPKTVSLAWSETTFTYDKYTHAPKATAGGLVNKDAVGVTVAGGQIQAGTYTATASGLTGEKAGNYQLPGVKTTAFTIQQRPVTIGGLRANSKVYDGTTEATQGQQMTLTNMVAGDDVTIVRGTAAFDSKNAGENRTVTFSGFSLTGKDAGNYLLTSQPAACKASIYPRPVTITGAKAEDKVYDGTTTAKVTGTLGISNAVTGETVTAAAGSAEFDEPDAGERNVRFYGFTLANNTEGNYKLSAQPGTVKAKITKKALTITAQNRTITYGAKPGYSVKYSGFAGTDGAGSLGGKLTYTCDYTQFGDVGSYPITISGVTSGNYDITFVPATLTVQQKEIGLEWDNTTPTYNRQKQAPKVTVTGTVNNDAITATVDSVGPDAGSYTCSVTGLTGAKAKNYKLPANPSTTVTIQKARLDGARITLASKLIYSGAEQTQAIKVTLPGMDLTEGTEYTVTGATGTEAGDYTLTVKAAGNNFTGQKTRKFTIARKPVDDPKIEIAAGSVYDGNEKKPAVTVKDEYTVIPDTEYQIAYANNKNAGTASVIITDKEGGNYELSEKTGNFTIAKGTREAPPKPTAQMKSEYSITLAAVQGCEYRMDEGEWQSGRTFSGLASASTHKFEQRYKETANYNYSQASSETISAGDHVHNWTITAAGNVITAICENKAGHGTDKPSTLAIIAPERKIYSGPESEEATLDGAIDGYENPVIEYYKEGTKLDKAPTAAGSYTARIELEGHQASIDYTIAKAPSLISVKPKAKKLEYNGSDQVLVKAGEVPGNTLLYAVTVTETDKPAESTWTADVSTIKGRFAGDYYVWYKAVETDNYLGFEPEKVKVTIAKKPVLITGVTAKDKTYDGNATAEADITNAVIDGHVEGDELILQPGSATFQTIREIEGQEGSYELADDANAEQDKIVAFSGFALAGAAAGNYELADQPMYVLADIDQAILVIIPKEHTITYGEEPANAGVTYDGFIEGEDEKVLRGTLQYQYSYAQYDDAAKDTYFIAVSGQKADNYCVFDWASILTVKPKTVELKWGETAFAYDGKKHVPTAEITGIVNNDEVYVTVSGAARKAGTHTATATLGGDKAGNYQLPAENTITFTIGRTAAGCTPPAARTELIYDGAEQELVSAGEAEGGTMFYALGDTESAPAADSGKWAETLPTAKNAGSYTVWYKVTGDEDHVDVAPAKVTAAIGAKPVTISGLSADDKEYDGKTAAVASGTAEIVGKVAEDQVTVTAGAANFDTPAVGKDKTVVFSGYGLAGADAGNYALAAQPASVKAAITQHMLIVGANYTVITYGDAPTNTGVDYYNGFAEGEDASVLGGQLAYTTSYHQFDPAAEIDYYIMPEGLTSDNYELIFFPNFLTVEPKETGVQWGETNFTYDGTAHVPTVSVTGLVNNDAVGINVSGEEVNAGTYTATATGLTGEKADNYKRPETATVSYTIAKKNVTVSGIRALDKPYDGTATATLDFTEAIIDGVLTGDDLTLSGTAVFDSVDVGGNKTVTITGLTLTGAAAGNYQLAAEGQQTTTLASITPNELGLTVTGYSGVYDGKAHGITVTADTEGVLLTYSDKEDGDYSKVNPGFADAGTYTVYYKASKTGATEMSGKATVTIEKSEVTVGGIQAMDKFYDGNRDATLDYTNMVVHGKVEGEALTITAVGRFTDPDVGENKTVNITKIALGGDYAKNYALAGKGNQSIATASIKANAMGITAKGYEGTYDGKEHSITVSTTEEGATIRYSEKEDGSYSKTNPSYTKAGVYPVYYKVTKKGSQEASGCAKVIIGKKEITVSGIKALDKLYDGTTEATLDYSGVKTAGLLEGDRITVTAKGTFDDAEPGKKKTVVISELKLDGESAGNYTLAKEGQQTAATASVLTQAVTVTAAGYEGIYDGKAHSISVTTEEKGVTIRYSESEKGTYTETNPAYTLPGTYKVYYTASKKGSADTTGSAQVVIGKKEVTVSGIAALDKLEDGTTDAMLDYSGAKTEGVIKGDEVTVSATGAFEDAKPGKGKTVAITGLTLGGQSAGNYTLAKEGQQTAATATIRKNELGLTVTGYEGVYDKAAHGITVTTNMAGVTITYSEKQDGKYSEENPQYTDAGVHTVYFKAVSGKTEAAGAEIVTIGKKSVTVSGITAQDKTQDGTTDATLDFSGAKIDGLLEGDAVTVTAKGAFENAEAGEKKTVTITNLTLEGAGAGNYQLAAEGQQTTTKATIRKKDGGKRDVSIKGLKYTADLDKGTATVTGTEKKTVTSVKIPDSIQVNGVTCKVTAIGDKAFQGLAKLKTATIGKNVQTIGKSAFDGDKALKTVKGGENVTTLGDAAFQGCTKLKSFTIAKTVTRIGKKAFQDCKGLKTITINAAKLTEKSIGAGAFTGTPKDATYKCPKGTAKKYKKILTKKGASKTATYK